MSSIIRSDDAGPSVARSLLLVLSPWSARWSLFVETRQGRVPGLRSVLLPLRDQRFLTTYRRVAAGVVLGPR